MHFRRRSTAHSDIGQLRIHVATELQASAQSHPLAV